MFFLNLRSFLGAFPEIKEGLTYTRIPKTPQSPLINNVDFQLSSSSNQIPFDPKALEKS